MSQDGAPAPEAAPTDRGNDADTHLAQLVERLRERGTRVTSARRALLSALVHAGDRHPSAQDLAEAVQRAQPDVHLSTVYRSLDSLEELGIVDHVHLGHGRAIYHLADRPHHHLVCESCGLVVEVPDAEFDELAAQVRASYGFAIRPHHFAILGRCERCEGPVDAEGPRH